MTTPRESLFDDRPLPPPLVAEWTADDDNLYVGLSVRRDDEAYPFGPMVNADCSGFDGEFDIDADEARQLAVALMRAADACDVIRKEIANG